MKNYEYKVVYLNANEEGVTIKDIQYPTYKFSN